MTVPGFPRLQIAITGLLIGWENVIVFTPVLAPPFWAMMSPAGGALSTSPPVYVEAGC